MGNASSQFKGSKSTIDGAANGFIQVQREIDREFEKLQSMTSQMLRRVPGRPFGQTALLNSAHAIGEVVTFCSPPVRAYQRGQTRKAEPAGRARPDSAALTRDQLSMLGIEDDSEPIKTLQRK